VSEESVAVYRPPLAARILSEFIGTYVVVLTFGMCAVSAARAESVKTTTAGPKAVNPTQIAGGTHTMTPYAMGSAVLSMTYALGSVSGAHFNPAVTLAVACSSRDPYVWAEAPTRVISQASAAFAAGLTYLYVSRGSLTATEELGAGRYLPHLGPGENISWTAVDIGEAFCTMAIAYVVLCVTTVKSARYSKAPSTTSFEFGLAIGFSTMAGGWILEAVSGGMMNPAVSFGVGTADVLTVGMKNLGTASNLEHLATVSHALLRYVAWQLAGGVMASVLFWLTHPMLYKPDPLLMK